MTHLKSLQIGQQAQNRRKNLIAFSPLHWDVPQHMHYTFTTVCLINALGEIIQLGGLRRAFQSLAPSLRLDWLSKLQATGGMAADFIEKISSNPVEAGCIFEHTHDTQNTGLHTSIRGS